MSKKYDELVGSTNNLFSASGEYLPMHPKDVLNSEEDRELLRELRDRTIINLVETACKVGMTLSYGDILKIVDGDSTEKEYEESKASVK